MKLTPISLTRNTAAKPMARVTANGILSLNAQAVQQFGLKAGQTVQVATNEEDPDSKNLYLIFTTQGDSLLKLSGKKNNLNIAFRSVLNSLGIDPQSHVIDYHLTREFTAGGNRVIELAWKGKKARG